MSRRIAIFAILSVLLLAVAGVTAAQEGVFGGGKQTGKATEGKEAVKSQEATPKKSSERPTNENRSLKKDMNDESAKGKGDPNSKAADEPKPKEERGNVAGGSPDKEAAEGKGKAWGKSKAEGKGKAAGRGNGAYVFHGVITAADDGTIVVNVEQGNNAAKPHIGKEVSFAITERTMLVGAGQPAAGERAMVQSMSGGDGSFEARIVAVKGTEEDEVKEGEAEGKAKAAEAKGKAAGKGKGGE